jgi:hypothetical protein
MIEIEEHSDFSLLPIKVVPNASRDRIGGELAGELKVFVSAAPEKGKANKAVCRLLAKGIGLKPQQVSVASGQTNPRKLIRLEGIAAAELRARLGI